jgi:hypothetical protein
MWKTLEVAIPKKILSFLEWFKQGLIKRPKSAESSLTTPQFFFSFGLSFSIYMFKESREHLQFADGT